MISKKRGFDYLIFFSLVCFGFVGSLSHFFNIILIIIVLYHVACRKFSSNSSKINKNSKVLYAALSAIFFFFLIRGMFHTNPLESLDSLSPMLPLPLIGLLVISSTDDELRITPAQLALYAKISIAIAFIIYCLFTTVLKGYYGLNIYSFWRLELFSGNPIPFSTATFGLTIFCLANWKDSKKFDKLLTIVCFLIGMYLSGILSGTRGTFVAIIVSLPILFWFISNSFLIFLFVTVCLVSTGWIAQINGLDLIDLQIFQRITRGLETLTTSKNTDISVNVRLDLWAACIKTIQNIPIFGYDVSNRFSSIQANLPDNFGYTFTHPHNDIFAAIISVGFLGALLSVFSLLAPIWAALMSQDEKDTRLFLGLTITVSTLATATVNTVFFNDITSAWLAFATFLIWNLKYAEKGKRDI